MYWLCKPYNSIVGGYEWALITFLYYVVIFFTLTKFYLIKMEAQNPATEMPSIPLPWFSSLRAVAVLVSLKIKHHYPPNSLVSIDQKLYRIPYNKKIVSQSLIGRQCTLKKLETFNGFWNSIVSDVRVVFNFKKSCDMHILSSCFYLVIFCLPSSWIFH